MDKFLMLMAARMRWRKNGCSVQAWSLYTDLFFRKNDGGFVVASSSDIKNSAGIGNHKTYVHALDELVGSGLVGIIQYGKGRTSVYKLLDLDNDEILHNVHID